MTKNVIVLEFNELSPLLLDRFIAAGELPNFKRLRDESIVAITDAEESPPALEPWIQWVTVHTGLSYGEHGVFQLNEGAKLDAPRIWDIVSDAGAPVWICGSMNAGIAGGTINGYILPDPWATGVEAVPATLFEPYMRLVRQYVQEHSSGRPNVGTADYLRFARFMIANGLSAKTVWSAVRQLAGERRDQSQWRRAAILDRLQWDLFRAFYHQLQPRLATFFLNSTAHFQHFHWREMDPSVFTVKPDERAIRKYGEAILFGYRSMDELVGEALKLAGPETSVVLCTALSQQPMLTYEEQGGRQIYRHRDLKALLAFAGIDAGYEYAPIMSQQFILHFADEAVAIEAARKLKALRLDDGRDVMMSKREGTKVSSGCMIDTVTPAGAQVTGAGSNQAQAFDALFYPLEALRSGMHHPDGVLWIRTPERRHAILDRRVSLREIAPTLLNLVGLRSPHAFALPAMPELPELGEMPERRSDAA